MAFFELIMEDFSTEDVSQDVTQESEPISWMDTEADSSSEAGNSYWWMPSGDEVLDVEGDTSSETGRTPIGGFDVEGDSSRD